MTDFTELKKKQRATWALGEYDRIADGLTISTDQTLRVAKLRPGERVLDLATGTGITAIAARERGAKVTAVDLTPELLAVARKKAQDEGFGDIDFREGDAEALPSADASFDVVLSTCGHMFAPDQPKVAAELARVTRPGGRVAFLAWTPEGGLGGWFRITNEHVPPPAGLASPFNWGDPEKVRQLLGNAFRDLSFVSGDCPQFGGSRHATARPSAAPQAAGRCPGGPSQRPDLLPRRLPRCGRKGALGTRISHHARCSRVSDGISFTLPGQPRTHDFACARDDVCNQRRLSFAYASRSNRKHSSS